MLVTYWTLALVTLVSEDTYGADDDNEDEEDNEEDEEDEEDDIL